MITKQIFRRAVLKIGPNEPSELSIQENARGLARYASICQVRPINNQILSCDYAHYFCFVIN